MGQYFGRKQDCADSSDLLRPQQKVSGSEDLMWGWYLFDAVLSTQKGHERLCLMGVAKKCRAGQLQAAFLSTAGSLETAN